EQDDMENWNYAHAASRGAIARQYPYNYEMGLGRGTRTFEDHGLRLPGLISVVTDSASENNQRGFYTRWRQLMEAESWAEITGACVDRIAERGGRSHDASVLAS